MLAGFRKYLTIKQFAAIIVALIVAPFWVFNFENWLAAKELDKVLILSEKPVMVALQWIIEALSSQFIAGAVTCFLFIAFLPNVWRWAKNKYKKDPGIVLKEVLKEDFEYGTIELDGKRFIGCRFLNVTFEYNGGPVEMIDCRLSTAHITFLHTDSNTVGAAIGLFAYGLGIPLGPEVSTANEGDHRFLIPRPSQPEIMMNIRWPLNTE